MTTSYLASDLEREEGRVRVTYPDVRSPLGQACKKLGLRMQDYKQVPNYATLSGKPWTIGIGCTGPNIGPGLMWTDAQIDAELERRIDDIKAQLDARAPWWTSLDDVRQDALVMMCFQLGVDKVLYQFPRTVAFIKAQDWANMAKQMRGVSSPTPWYTQTPKRVNRLIEQFTTGVRAWSEQS